MLELAKRFEGLFLGKAKRQKAGHDACAIVDIVACGYIDRHSRAYAINADFKHATIAITLENLLYRDRGSGTSVTASRTAKPAQMRKRNIVVFVLVPAHDAVRRIRKVNYAFGINLATYAIENGVVVNLVGN